MPTYTAGNPEEKSRASHVEAGEYNLIIANAEEALSSNSNEMIKIKLRVTQPHFDGDEGPVVFDNLVFTERAFWKIDQFLKAIGEHPGEGREVSVDPDDLIGKMCKAKLSVGQTSQGKPCNDLDHYITPSEGF